MTVDKPHDLMMTGPTHCYRRCPELIRTLGAYDSDADDVPMIPDRCLVKLAATTCPTCLAFAAAPAPFSDGVSNGGGLVAEEARR